MIRYLLKLIFSFPGPFSVQFDNGVHDGSVVKHKILEIRFKNLTSKSYVIKQNIVLTETHCYKIGF